MAIKPILQFRNPDSTLDLNTTQARIVDRAIFDGGSLTLSGVALQVTIAPFIASGYDGMVAVSDAIETRSVPAPAVAGPNRVSYLILHLEYRSLTSPIFNLQVIPETTWLTSVSKNFFITFAKFSVPFGATSLTDPGVTVDYSVGDWADKLGKTGWRMPVATFASLPTTGNRDGDVRIAFDTRLAYAWNASLASWSPIGNAINLAEVASRSAESVHQFHRVTSGSGLLNEIPQSAVGSSVGGDAVRVVTFPSTSDTYPAVRFPFIPLPGVANSAIVPGCHYLMNGHLIKTHATGLDAGTLGANGLQAPPGVGERIDLLILEAWRVLISLPSTETYKDESAVSQSFTTLRTALEHMTEQGGTLAPSFDFSEMTPYSSTSFVVTRYQYKVIQNVNISVLTDSSTVAAAINNFDGNPFSVGTNTDQKLWQATSATSVDGVSWAIPLVAMRRTSAELAGPPFIDTFRNSERFIFDVCPRAELALGLFELQAAVALSDRHNSEASKLERPSGFVTGTGSPIVINDGSLDIPASVIQISGRRLYWSDPKNVLLPAAPVGAGSRTDLLVMEIFETAYPPPDFSADAPAELKFRARMGPKSNQWVGKFKFISLPLNVLQTTVEGAMAASGLYTFSSLDTNVWHRAANPAAGEDPTRLVLAMAICLVQRRNTGAYAVSLAAQNGADRSAFPGLPNQPATFPYESELLDLRSRTVETPEELQRILDESLDQLMSGELRTHMRTHPVASNVAGKQLLQVDQISAAVVAGTHHIPYSPNGITTVWAESDEAELFTWEMKNLTLNQSDAAGVFSWDAATSKLSITLPAGYTVSLDGQTRRNPYGPQNYIAYSRFPGGDERPYPMVHTYATGAIPGGDLVVGDPVVPTPLQNTFVNLALDGAVAYTDAQATVSVGVWAVKRNHEAGHFDVANSYANNRGLFAVPDVVRRIDYSFTGAAPFTRAWVGVPLNTIDVPVVGDALVISQAALFASGSISAELASVATNLLSFAVVNVTLDTTSAPDKFRYIQFTDAAGALPGFERVRIEFNAGSVPGGTTARVTLVCTGDLVDQWFEVDPASKQLRGPYGVLSQSFNIGASTGNFTESVTAVCPWSDCGISVLGGASSGTSTVAGSRLNGLFLPGYGDVAFYANGTGNTAWEVWFSSVDRNSVRNISSGQSLFFQQGVDPVSLGYMDTGLYNSMVSVRYAYTAGVFGVHKLNVISPSRNPLPVGSAVRVFYEYTPYQGITTSLATKLVGTVEAVSDQLVFTNGPNKPWIDYRALSTSVRRAPLNESPPGLYALGSSSSDMGLFYSKGRVVDRAVLQTNDGPSAYGGYYVRQDKELPFRPGDRPILALSQRLPFPTKQPDGTNPNRYSPESFLSNSALLDALVVRSVPITSGYPRSEASPWVLEYSPTCVDEQVWRSTNNTKTLYFPLPVNSGETVVGFTMGVESTGLIGVLTCQFYLKDRLTGTLTPVSGLSSDSIKLPVPTPAGTRTIHEVSILPITTAGDPQSELLLAVTCGNPNSIVAFTTISVVPNTFYTEGSATIRRYPYDDSSAGLGRTLRKGVRIDIPSSWTTEFTAYEAALIRDGRQDFPGVSPSRGRALVASIAGSDSYGSGGLLGYVPGGTPSDAVILEGGYTSAPSLVGRETAPRFNSKPRSVFTGATAPDVSVGSALSYLVRIDTNPVFMGVSTGYTNIVNGTALVRVGQAVDAFFPVGRPVFKRV